MKYRCTAVMLALCLLLTGCSILDRDYSTMEPHDYSYREEEDETALRVTGPQNLINAVLSLVEAHQETARIHYYESGNYAIWKTLNDMRQEIMADTPIGAYLLENITWESTALRNYYEIDISFSYRRSAEEEDNIIDASSSNAVYDLVPFALEEKRQCLAVRFAHLEEAPDEFVLNILALQFPKEEDPVEPDIVIDPDLDGTVPPDEGGTDGKQQEETTENSDKTTEVTVAPPTDNPESSEENNTPDDIPPDDTDDEEPVDDPVITPPEIPWEVYLYPGNENAGIVEIYFW